MITFSTLTMRIYTLLYKGPIRPTEVHKNRGAAAWFYHLDSPVPSACGTLQSRNVPTKQLEEIAGAIIKHVDTTIRRVEVITAYELT